MDKKRPKTKAFTNNANQVQINIKNNKHPIKKDSEKIIYLPKQISLKQKQQLPQQQQHPYEKPKPSETPNFNTTSKQIKSERNNILSKVIFLDKNKQHIEMNSSSNVKNKLLEKNNPINLNTNDNRKQTENEIYNNYTSYKNNNSNNKDANSFSLNKNMIYKRKKSKDHCVHKSEKRKYLCNTPVVYEKIKMYFFTVESKFGIVWAQNFDIAAIKLGTDVNNVYNLAVFVIPFIVSVFCIVGFIVAFRMPRNYSFKEIVNQMDLPEEKRLQLLENAEEEETEESSDLIINIPLWVLSGSIFGLFWRYDLVVNKTTFKSKKCAIIHWLVSILFFPYNAYLMYKCEKENVLRLKSRGAKVCDLSVLVFVLSFLGLSIGSYIIIQNQLNRWSKRNESIQKNI
jgi:hypothetical protein